MVTESSGDERMEKMLSNFLKRRFDNQRRTRVSVLYNQRDQPDSWTTSRERNTSSHEGHGRKPRSPMTMMHDRKDDFLKSYRWLSLEGVQLFASIELMNGKWLNIESSFKLPKRSLAPVVLPMIIMALLIIFIVWFTINRLTKPLRTLATAANDLGRGAEVQPLPEAGPAEVRAATRSFNEMQERLTRFIADRTRMLAAISHDLRTPITSLRIRAEFVEDDEDRERMIATLDEMRAIVEETLSFTRDASTQEEVRSVDLGGLLESIANDHEDMGDHVGVESESRVVLKCRPGSLKRAFRNLIGNAIRYGGAVEVFICLDDDHAEVRIADKGPGIPENRLEDVFEPFVRLEESRSEQTGGIGLGLAITRSIIHAQGGTIRLKNGPEKGLVAIVRLPL